MEGENAEGTAILEKLADIITRALKTKLPGDKTKELLEAHPRPSNLTALKTPRVHEGVWKNLPHDVKTFELQLSKIGEKAMKAVTGCSRLTERLAQLKDNTTDRELRKELRDVVKSQIDVMKVSILALHDVHQARRTKLRPRLHTDYRSVRDTPAEEGEWIGRWPRRQS